jgi:2-furoyl-CoA dehydrogenase large subunit
LNPVLFDGQVLSGFAHGRDAALYEELAYSDDDSFLSGTFADYPVPTACEQTGCIANAVADALGVAVGALPLTPQRVAALV